MQAAGVAPDEVTYSAVISAYARKADTEGAQRCLKAMQAAQVTSYEITYTAMINALCTPGVHFNGVAHGVSIQAVQFAANNMPFHTGSLTIRVWRRFGDHVFA